MCAQWTVGVLGRFAYVEVAGLACGDEIAQVFVAGDVAAEGVVDMGGCAGADAWHLELTLVVVAVEYDGADLLAPSSGAASGPGLAHGSRTVREQVA